MSICSTASQLNLSEIWSGNVGPDEPRWSRPLTRVRASPSLSPSYTVALFRAGDGVILTWSWPERARAAGSGAVLRLVEHPVRGTKGGDVVAIKIHEIGYLTTSILMATVSMTLGEYRPQMDYSSTGSVVNPASTPCPLMEEVSKSDPGVPCLERAHDFIVNRSGQSLSSRVTSSRIGIVPFGRNGHARRRRFCWRTSLSI